MSTNDNTLSKVEDETQQKQEIKTSENKGFIKNLIDSLFNVDINKYIHNIARVVFILAIISAFVLVILSKFNIHTIILAFLIIGLFASVELFNYQLKEIKKEKNEVEENSEVKKNN
ncbi:hypothetical protein BCR32DRAFT_269006 [Anaeromyces robustus]|uniref:Uncharacterized protein n=1 Tax=Anaeromyces robustus TaxID=1754192 RepID=A0A1Y1X2Y3_9FUNG|nr:hypothetical protein BCR32DRAFT_269006 [Anaeromyces robustus]|eukprot:ORX80170.1 hypothetical protein BCR32DRAFT_269006 [Anaeromyces robustus]